MATEDIDAIRRKKMVDMMNQPAEAPLPNTVVEINGVDHFNELLEKYSGSLFITDFWAPWCGPCRAFAPAYTALEAEYRDKRVIFTKLNVDEHQSIAGQFGVSGIPTTIFIHNKKLVHRQVGMMPKPQFAKVIDSVLEKANKE